MPNHAICFSETFLQTSFCNERHRNECSVVAPCFLAALGLTLSLVWLHPVIGGLGSTLSAHAFEVPSIAGEGHLKKPEISSMGLFRDGGPHCFHFVHHLLPVLRKFCAE